MASIDFSPSDNKFRWIDVTAPTIDELLEIGKEFDIHPYSIRDCLEPDHLPKFETQDNYHFIISRLMLESNNFGKLQTAQQMTSKVAMFYNDNFLITIHRLPYPFFEEIKTKYLTQHRSTTTHEIVVRVLWYVLQTYEPHLTIISKEIDIYEERIFLKNLSSLMMKNLYFLKRRIHIAYKLLQMTGMVTHNIQSKDKIALNDLRDNQLKLTAMYGQYHDDVTSLLNFYLSLSSQKTNEVMRILTVFSAFFLPLTFIVGIYGMNFEYMPELKYKLGYPLTWAAMILVTIIIYQWFWRKKWL